MTGSSQKSGAYMTGKDMLLLPDGSTYHLGVKAGEIFPRILTVGAASRAKAIATLFDKEAPVKELTSSRQFHVISGYYKGVGISIIAIGMGAPMMDFMVREASFVQPGPLAIIRLGTCGLFNPKLNPGTVVSAGKGSLYVYVNYGRFSGGCVNEPKIDASSPPYLVSNPIPCDAKLNGLLVENLQKSGFPTHDGLNACGETFYSCQGRNTVGFEDDNGTIVQTLLDQGVDFMEMETHQLFHQAMVRTDPCHVAAAAIGIVNRTNPDITVNITADGLHKAEVDAGRACLEALKHFEF